MSATLVELQVRHEQARRHAAIAADLSHELKVAEYRAELAVHESQGLLPARQAWLRWYVAPETSTQDTNYDALIAAMLAERHEMERQARAAG